MTLLQFDLHRGHLARELRYMIAESGITATEYDWQVHPSYADEIMFCAWMGGRVRFVCVGARHRLAYCPEGRESYPTWWAVDDVPEYTTTRKEGRC